NFFSPQVGPSITATTLQVAAPVSAASVNLVPGCNNITPTVTEGIEAYNNRIDPRDVVYSFWQFDTAGNRFLGAPGRATQGSGARPVADLNGVTRLIPVFVCVRLAATLSQPAP